MTSLQNSYSPLSKQEEAEMASFSTLAPTTYIAYPGTAMCVPQNSSNVPENIPCKGKWVLFDKRSMRRSCIARILSRLCCGLGILFSLLFVALMIATGIFAGKLSHFSNELDKCWNSPGESVQQSFVLKPGLQSLKISLTSGQIRIFESMTKNVEMVVISSASDSDALEGIENNFDYESGVLLSKSNSLYFKKCQTVKVELRVPKASGNLGLNLSVEAGYISFENSEIISLGNVSMYSGMGAVLLKNVIVGSYLDAESKFGAVLGRNIAAVVMKGRVKFGAVGFKNVMSNDLKLSSELGWIGAHGINLQALDRRHNEKHLSERVYDSIFTSMRGADRKVTEENEPLSKVAPTFMTNSQTRTLSVSCDFGVIEMNDFQAFTKVDSNFGAVIVSLKNSFRGPFTLRSESGYIKCENWNDFSVLLTDEPNLKTGYVDSGESSSGLEVTSQSSFIIASL